MPASFTVFPSETGILPCSCLSIDLELHIRTHQCTVATQTSALISPCCCPSPSLYLHRLPAPWFPGTKCGYLPLPSLSLITPDHHFETSAHHKILWWNIFWLQWIWLCLPCSRVFIFGSRVFQQWLFFLLLEFCFLK